MLPVHQLEAFPSEGGHRLQGVAYREEQNLDAALLVGAPLGEIL